MSRIIPLGYPAWISTRDIFAGLNPLGNISPMRPGWYTSSKPSFCELMVLVNPAGWWFQYQTYLYQVESPMPEFPNINSFSHQQSVSISIKRFNHWKRLVRSGSLYMVHPCIILILILALYNSQIMFALVRFQRNKKGAVRIWNVITQEFHYKAGMSWIACTVIDSE